MPRFLDSHCHLADPRFDADRPAVIDRARQAGAVGLVCIGESLDAATRARAIAADHPGFVHFTAGVHPHDAHAFNDARDLPLLRELLAMGAVGVGECGLDYHYDHSPRAAQRAAFAAQLGLADECGRPAIVHSRLAEDDTAAMVAEAGTAGVRGVLHCFTGSARLAEVAIEGGWYLSFSGIVTFRTWSDDAVARLVPRDRILVESDAPYLAPAPHRGKRNEPAWVSHTVDRLALARGEPVGELADAVTANALRLFGLAVTPAR